MAFLTREELCHARGLALLLEEAGQSVPNKLWHAVGSAMTGERAPLLLVIGIARSASSTSTHGGGTAEIAACHGPRQRSAQAPLITWSCVAHGTGDLPCAAHRINPRGSQCGAQAFAHNESTHTTTSRHQLWQFQEAKRLLWPAYLSAAAAKACTSPAETEHHPGERGPPPATLARQLLCSN